MSRRNLIFLFLLCVMPFSIVSASVFELNASSQPVNSIKKNSGPSVILMIGDGMGFEQVKLARLVEVGEHGNLNMETLPYQFNVTAPCLDRDIPDSATAATAMATGYKTNVGMLSVTPDGDPLETILEQALNSGKSTGFISTTEIDHATPAAFYAQVASRENKSEIRRQLIEDAEVDVIMSGGESRLNTAQISAMEAKGYTVAKNRTDLAAIESGKILGLFDPVWMGYAKDWDYDVKPTITELTSKALDILSQDADGFFLMVEGGMIDYSCHNHDKENAGLETIEFDKAVQVAIDFVQTHENTILLVGADHETGGLTVIFHTLNDTLPLSSDPPEIKRQVRLERINQVEVNWSTYYHTTADVPFYGIGRGLSTYNQTLIDNTEIYAIMKNYLDSDPDDLSLKITNPLNQTYSLEKLWVTVSLPEPYNWLSYSLDGSDNVTLQHPNALLELSEGSHHLIVFANVSSNIINKSEVFFTIDFPDASSTTTSSTTTSTSPSPGFLYALLVLGLIIFIVNRKKRID